MDEERLAKTLLIFAVGLFLAIPLGMVLQAKLADAAGNALGSALTLFGIAAG
jgi:hypothetical protein